MNRTQEQYTSVGLREPVPDDFYKFAEWSEWRLEQRLADVMESSQLAHSEPRQAQIRRELNHLIFELTYRETVDG